MSREKEEIDRLVKLLEEVMLDKEHILDAIRDHRASKTPESWSREDAKLYSQLPEVRHTGLESG